MTLEQLRPLLLRLMLAFGQPFGFSGGASDDLLRTWLNVLEDCELRDVSAAVDQWIRTSKKWPAPAQIREDAFGLLRARKPHATQHTGFCIRCNTPDLISLANGRFMPLHADNCPGLHESDRQDILHALSTHRDIWRNGAPPRSQKLVTAEAAD